ncbi:uncharacterized protein LOC136091313 [Hydra vulgaris]|uniref:Uncharacterized protein LOC136091313 n=1 Tax=Hydra vulgaris TaxID=6087 RepID=A0ABM4DJV5_HYDVU
MKKYRSVLAGNLFPECLNLSSSCGAAPIYYLCFNKLSLPILTAKSSNTLLQNTVRVLPLSHNLDEDNIFIEDFRNLMKIIILMLIKDICTLTINLSNQPLKISIFISKNQLREDLHPGTNANENT